MQDIDSRRGSLGLLCRLNFDRFLYLGAIGASLGLAAFVGTP